MSPQEIARELATKRSSPLLHEDTGTAHATKTTTIAVVGLGYVGLPLAILASRRGYKVVGFDIDEVKIAQLQEREANFLNDDDAEAFREAKDLVLTDNEQELNAADTFIVCVPTPVHENHIPDLGPVISASTIVGKHLRRGALVVIESTVNPGVCERISLPILEKVSGLSRDDFHFAHCPERINPGDAKWDVRTIPRVIGGLNPESLDRAATLYESLIEAQIVRMKNIKEAEAVKMVENSFRDINIAFVNELAMAFDKAGIDIVNVIRGASSKPFAFMPHFPGCGVGGHCIPVDPYYLIRYGQENGFEHRFLMTARRINSGMPIYAVQMLDDMLRSRSGKFDRRRKSSLRGVQVALLGLAYKRDVPDLRESPALIIKKELEKRGADVRTYDPYAVGASSEKTLEDALVGADAALIATDHTLFRTLSPQSFEKYGVGVVVDGRNCLDKESFLGTGIAYRGIGRT